MGFWSKLRNFVRGKGWKEDKLEVPIEEPEELVEYEEKKEAENFIEIVNKSGRWKNTVVTNVETIKRFYPAEDYHQDYLRKNPGGYTCHAIYFDSYIY